MIQCRVMYKGLFILECQKCFPHVSRPNLRAQLYCTRSHFTLHALLKKNLDNNKEANLSFFMRCPVMRRDTFVYPHVGQPQFVSHQKREFGLK